MEPQPESPESFDVDGMLGKLAKWLRILGFDTAYPCRTPSQGRIFVTARSRPKYSGAVIVRSINWLEQLKYVLDQADVKPDPELFLSRCLVCNVAVHEVSRKSVKKQVPSAIATTVREFRQCPVCGRVYWGGSHGARMKRRLLDAGISQD
jgi:uncharacterized protein with PIN domain